MADPREKNENNAAGRYYVDSSCIDCDLCRESAPRLFAREEDECYSYVLRQPETEQEIQLCHSILEACPVEAIGDDGEE